MTLARTLALGMLLVGASVLALLPHAAAAQGTPVVVPRGRLTEQQARAVADLPYVPTQRVLRWSGDSLLISHYDVHGTGLGFFVNCFGSGFFSIPVAGGYPSAVAEPFCALGGSMSATPDGRAVLFFGEPAYGRRADGSSGRLADAPLMRFDFGSSVVDTLRTNCGSGARDVAVSSRGQLAWTGTCAGGTTPGTLASLGVNEGIWVAPLAGGEPRRFGGPDGVDAHEPSWSPDGGSVVFTVGENPLGGRWEVSGAEPGALMIADASGERPLGVAGESAVWSPDGTRIAFFADDGDDPSEEPGGPRIYVMGADGGGRRRIFMNDLTTTYPEYFYGPFPTYVRDGKAFGPLVWSPDGAWLAFSRQFEAGASIWRLEVDGGRLEPVTAPDR